MGWRLRQSETQLGEIHCCNWNEFTWEEAALLSQPAWNGRDVLPECRDARVESCKAFLAREQKRPRYFCRVAFKWWQESSHVVSVRHRTRSRFAEMKPLTAQINWECFPVSKCWSWLCFVAQDTKMSKKKTTFCSLTFLTKKSILLSRESKKKSKVHYRWHTVPGHNVPSITNPPSIHAFIHYLTLTLHNFHQNVFIFWYQDYKCIIFFLFE